jgi:hypothetical protein
MQDTAMTSLLLLAIGAAIGSTVLTRKTWPDIKESFDRVLWITVMVLMPWTAVAVIIAKLLGYY